MRDECWHPECYMINKVSCFSKCGYESHSCIDQQFWNVKVVSRRPTSVPLAEGESQEPVYLEEERKENAFSLREKQVRMEQQVYRIWTCVPNALPFEPI